MGSTLYACHPSWPPAHRWRRRFALACGTSLMVHVWLARELPAGAPRAAGGAVPLTVRIQRDAPPGKEVVTRFIPTARALASPAASRGTPVKEEGARPARTRRQAQLGDNPARGALAADSTYYSARDLDVYPVLLVPLALYYPERALSENRAGRARAVVTIDAAGRVQQVSVEESDPPGYFEEAARKTLEGALFSAARRHGLPVGSRVVITLDFDPAAAMKAP